MTRASSAWGFTLTELLVAMALSALVITGSIRIAAAIHAAWRSQQNLSALQHNARFAFENFGAHIAPAGYAPAPWSDLTATIHPDTTNALTAYSDRLVLNRWSDKNCFGNPNPALDAGGIPAQYLLESAFWVSTSRNLTMRCRYGADAGSLVTQLSSFGLLEDVHAMQLLFAEDTVGDLNADRWVRAGHWSDEKTVMAVRIGLLLGTPETVHAPTSSPYLVLDQSVSKQDNGAAYRVFETIIPIRARVQ